MYNYGGKYIWYSVFSVCITIAYKINIAGICVYMPMIVRINFVKFYHSWVTIAIFPSCWEIRNMKILKANIYFRKFTSDNSNVYKMYKYLILYKFSFRLFLKKIVNLTVGEIRAKHNMLFLIDFWSQNFQ